MKLRDRELRRKKDKDFLLKSWLQKLLKENDRRRKRNKEDKKKQLLQLKPLLKRQLDKPNVKGRKLKKLREHWQRPRPSMNQKWKSNAYNKLQIKKGPRLKKPRDKESLRKKKKLKKPKGKELPPNKPNNNGLLTKKPLQRKLKDKE